ncbi:protein STRICTOSIDINE SYNTHASE-LIKE 4-like isoform X1 [Prosopis cineraria]|uniref:protein STRICTOSIDINE SYNTHASE-LIKE 4-like isoform X1 n=1 Tax=Prosopis cineraria TaxID=364024 RepID=UPI0024100BAD|nr:protein STRICTOSIDINE SYNTHASE-LIKE 4-like isoform X1 [Prosopis cineraria]XP_054790236.1 protein STRICTOSIDINE SYNTHASE-LIKE 4-like isoform X1 [Prosopis cineraria]
MQIGRVIMAWLAACSSLVLVALLALAVQVVYFSPIDPIIVERPPLASPFAVNNHLQNVIKLGEGILKDPEDVCVDKHGTLYTATRDGWIVRLHRNGSWEHWKNIHSPTMLGITVTTQGALIVCDSDKGLLKVTEDGVSVIVSQVNGSKLRFADEVVEASDGSLYFSIASTKYDLHEWYLDVLEARPHGQLLKYNPSLKDTSVFLDNLSFANGVALSKDEDYLLVCETWKYRCLRHWLKGEKKDKTETFIDNLPGGPDNIHLAPDGSFWIAMLQVTDEKLGFVHSWKVLKHLVASFPTLINVVRGIYKKAMVVNVGSDGEIIRIFDDDEGKVMNFVTSALEFEDHLYLGSLNSNFIGKLPLRIEK